VPRPAMVVSGGKLRPAAEGEISELAKRDIMPWELTRVPGRGKEGLERFLAEGEPPGSSAAEGFLITCTCGHLFLDELSDA
jgi:hypothetical protein